MSRRAVVVAAAIAVAAVACTGGPSEPAPAPAVDDLRSRAERLAHEVIIVDTHVDVPYRLQEEMEDISVRTAKGDFDYPRARDGGLDAPFMSIYIPASYQENGRARELADELIDMVEGFERNAPEKFAVARSPQEVRRHFEEGRIALPMGMENGAPIETLQDLAHFFDRGIRYITLTHSENNRICDSSYATERQWQGLSDFGKQVVAEMNRLGIMIDVSHVSDDTFDQVMELSGAPVIASHSSCRFFTPGWERNVDDRMIQALAERGGVVQINFGSAFLLDTAQKQSTDFWSAYAAFLRDNGIEPADARAKQFRNDYWQEHERIYADVTDVVDHIEHVIDVASIDHIGFGSDFDGVGDSLPTGLKDVSAYPNIIHELLKRGYSDEDIAKICGGNLLRVWDAVENLARQLQGAGS